MATLWQATPLNGIRVIELAGLAPGPFCGMILADYGATVLRIDRAHPQAHSGSSSDGDAGADDGGPPPTLDNLTRHKSSVALDLKSAGGLAVLRALLAHADVLIDPFRPGVLESLGLGPERLLAANPRLVVARLTGFRRDGPYAAMAGHDVNYLAVSGVLAQLGRAGAPPAFPANLLGDFAGGGLMCATGILLALLARDRAGGGGAGGKGQVVECNMVDGAAYLGSFLRLTRKRVWHDGPRGTNMLDGGSPWYDVYETKDAGKYMSVGALEPQFFAVLAKGLGLDPSWNDKRWDSDLWPELRTLMEKAFKSRTRAEWEQIFTGKDACCAPVLEQAELEDSGYEQRAAVGLTSTPSRPIDQHEAWNIKGLAPGQGGEKILNEWLGWEIGKHYHVEKGGLVKSTTSRL